MIIMLLIMMMTMTNCGPTSDYDNGKDINYDDYFHGNNKDDNDNDDVEDDDDDDVDDDGLNC